MLSLIFRGRLSVVAVGRDGEEPPTREALERKLCIAEGRSCHSAPEIVVTLCRSGAMWSMPYRGGETFEDVAHFAALHSLGACDPPPTPTRSPPLAPL